MSAPAQGTPLLGICLGMQLLFDSSTEHGGATPGLGLIAGAVRRIEADGLRVPHIGWNEVRFERESPLTADLPPHGRPFYHVHSYVAHPAEPTEVIGTAEYGERFATIVRRGNVYGTQFHPEKSSRDGLLLLACVCGAGASGSTAGRVPTHDPAARRSTSSTARPCAWRAATMPSRPTTTPIRSTRQGAGSMPAHAHCTSWTLTGPAPAYPPTSRMSARIAGACGVPVQVGGGLRSPEAVDAVAEPVRLV